MILSFLFACAIGMNTNGGAVLSASDSTSATGGDGSNPSWGTSGGSSAGSDAGNESNLRSGVFGMRDMYDPEINDLIRPDSYDEVTFVVECPITTGDNYNIRAFMVQVLNDTSGNDEFWFGNDPLIEAHIDRWDDTYCFWSEFRLDPGDVIIINGEIVGGEYDWLAEMDSTRHCNVMVVEPGGAESMLPTQLNWDGSGRDFVYDSGAVYY